MSKSGPSSSAAEATRLQRELERSRAKLVELEALKKRLRDSERQLTHERNRNRDLNLQLEAQKAKMSAVVAGIDELERDFELERRLVQALKEELQSKEECAEHMHSEQKSTLQVVRLLASDLQLALDIQAEMRTEGREVQDEAEELQALVETAERQRQVEGDQLRETSKALELRVRQEAQLREVAKDKLEKALEQVKELEGNKENVEAENCALREQLASVEGDLGALQEKYTKHRSILEHNLEEAETEIARIDDIHTDSVKDTINMLNEIDEAVLNKLPQLRRLKQRLEEELEDNGKMGVNCSIESTEMNTPSAN